MRSPGSRASFRGSSRRQRRSHRSMLERNARRCKRDGRAVPGASGTQLPILRERQCGGGYTADQGTVALVPEAGALSWLSIGLKSRGRRNPVSSAPPPRPAGRTRLWAGPSSRTARVSRSRRVSMGFCTPGLILGAVALLGQDPSPTAAVIREGLQGHVCRGGAYPQSVDAVRSGRGGRSRTGSRGSRAQMRQPLFTRPARKAFIKRSQTLPVLRASALDDIVVARSGNCPEVFRFWRRFEQRSAESHWDNIISAAVDEKDRGPNSRDLDRKSVV